tara:strand:+ start:3952 stop:4569 length:618 start_codon:yes stop_codon:yes gene_type:complete
MIEKLNYRLVDTGENPKKVIVALHGYQGTAKSMQLLIKLMDINEVTWFFPEAPYKVNEHNTGFSWSYQDKNGIWKTNEVKRLLLSFFDNLFLKYKSKNIYVIGFSQGAAICLNFVLKLDQTLGGVFPIAGFFRNPQKDSRINNKQKNTPIIIGHGINDDIVNYSHSIEAYQLLKKQNANVQLIDYKGRHKISIEYLKKIKNIIIK